MHVLDGSCCRDGFDSINGKSIWRDRGENAKACQEGHSRLKKLHRTFLKLICSQQRCPKAKDSGTLGGSEMFVFQTEKQYFEEVKPLPKAVNTRVYWKKVAGKILGTPKISNLIDVQQMQ